MPGGICLYEAVELLYLRPGVTDALAPADLAGRAEGAHDGLDAVKLGKFNHGNYVPERVLHVDVAVVAGYVVDAYKQHHVFRIEVYDVRADAGEQLHGGLTADAAANEVVLVQPGLVEAGPVARDAVSEKHRLGTGRHLCVLRGVVAEARPVLVRLVPRLGLRAHDSGPATAGGHLHRQLAVNWEVLPLLAEIAGGAVGIDAVAEGLDDGGTLDEGEVQRELAGVPVGDGAYVPGISAAAGHGHILPCLALKRAGLVPYGGHAGDELQALGLPDVVGRGVAEHGEGRVEDNVLRELAAAGALAHGLGAHEAEVLLRGVAHGALGVVAGAGDQADERNRGLVGDEVYHVLLPLYVLQAVHALHVDDVGPGAHDAGGLEGAVEVDHELIAGGGLGGTAVEVHHRLVVAVHEVHLEALHAHLRVLAAGALHVAFERPVAGPEDEADVLGLGVLA